MDFLSIQLLLNTFVPKRRPNEAPMWKQKIPIILVLAFSLTVFTHGLNTPIGVITPPTAILVVGLILTFCTRMSEGRVLIPTAILQCPVVIASLCYFACGIVSGLGAADKAMWMKEIVQRTIIIILPLLMFTLTPKKPEQIKYAIMTYIPLCLFVVVFASNDARQTGMSEASYTLGMHKNQVAGSCSVMSTIAIAAILTTRSDKRFKWLMVFVAAAGALGCFAAQGKAGMLCIIVATIFMFIAAKTSARTFITFFLTCVIAAAVMWKVMPDKAREHVVSTKKFSTTEIRMSLWTDVWPLLLAEPMSMVGWGNPLVKSVNGGEDKWFGDCANVLLNDWFQMSLAGPICLLGVIITALKQGLDNAKKLPLYSVLGFINLVALGAVSGRFTHAMLDTFWIGRGVTLVTWAAIGMMIWIKLYLKQAEQKKPRKGSRNARPALASTAR